VQYQSVWVPLPVTTTRAGRWHLLHTSSERESRTVNLNWYLLRNTPVMQTTYASLRALRLLQSMLKAIRRHAAK
jgi:hypothetical protein